MGINSNMMKWNSLFISLMSTGIDWQIKKKCNINTAYRGKLKKEKVWDIIYE